ncbi:hypothetical protein CROQUDRAFT_101262 [Cronartium quercuum f. sp. fusiforme G11]|uniref:Uncharacterized protein n=1 Tax=Cronartium quercuum f. sp. fusiforme G11 TaxID=708437 RepID=A0A9P6N5H0_9BASI|nr:hypothetical protein CROQUDRAFT_101262 [Cronartium quercuum f. sp. fusiforme G11]
MERSLKLLILFVGIFSISWVAFLILSTCMGPPIRRLLSNWWSDLVQSGQSNAIRINYDRLPLSLNSEDIELSGFDHHEPTTTRPYVSRDRFGRAALERSGL